MVSMPHINITHVCMVAIEVVEYYTARYGAPGQIRQKRKKPTPEQIERNNQRQKEKQCRRKLRMHFDIGDYFTTLTYERENRPEDMEQAKAHFREFMRTVRREYKKRGAAVKWIRNIEVGTKNAWHIHMVINRIPDTDIILRQAWRHGRVVSQLLHEKGEFKALAAYITKTEKTDNRLREANYSTSRNIPIPEPKETTYRRWKTWKAEPKIPEGFYLDKESVFEGINPVTGYKCRSYTLLRVKRKQKEPLGGKQNE